MNFHSKHALCQEKRQAVVWESVIECQIDLDSDVTMKLEILEKHRNSEDPRWTFIIKVWISTAFYSPFAVIRTLYNNSSPVTKAVQFWMVTFY